MTAITKDQIDQHLFAWEDLSRGYHGGRFDSKEICIFDEGGERGAIQFSIREYTSDNEDFFGRSCPAWRIIATCFDSERCVEVNRQEWATERVYELGDDYVHQEHAMEFCEYILASVLKYQNFSRLPYVELDPAQ